MLIAFCKTITAAFLTPFAKKVFSFLMYDLQVNLEWTQKKAVHVEYVDDTIR